MINGLQKCTNRKDKQSTKQKQKDKETHLEILERGDKQS
jgi:hypothetical protein